MDKKHLLILLILLVIAGGIYKKTQKDKLENAAKVQDQSPKPLPLPVSSTPLVTPTPAPTPADLTPAAVTSSTEDDQNLEESGVRIPPPDPTDRQKFLCSYFQSNHSLPIESKLLIPILRGDIKKILIPESLAGCLGEEKNFNLVFAHLNDHPSFIFAVDQNLSVIIDNKITYESKINLTRDAAFNDGSKYGAALQLWNAMSFYFSPQEINAKLVALTFHLGSNPIGKLYYFNPSNHPWAHTISRDEAANLVKGGAILVDSRIKEESSETPSVTNVPVRPKKARFRLYDATTIENQGVTLFLSSDVKASGKVIVMGQNQLDLSAYNLLTLLHQQDYKNLYYLRGGVDEWMGAPYTIPPSIEGAHSVDYPQFVSLRSTPNTQVIDVRSLAEFREGAVSGALSVPYESKLDKFDYPIVKGSELNSADLLLRTDFRFPYEKVPSQPTILVYGQNELDLRPFKVARILSAHGYKQVYYYPNGWAEWYFQSAVEGKKSENIDKKKQTLTEKEIKRLQELGVSVSSKSRGKNGKAVKLAGSRQLTKNNSDKKKFYKKSQVDENNVFKRKPIDKAKAIRAGQRK